MTKTATDTPKGIVPHGSAARARPTKSGSTGTSARLRKAAALGVKAGDRPIGPSKLDRIAALLARPEGATLAELCGATDWQAHSVRGALAGSLRKKGHAITSEKTDGVRRYRIGALS